MFLQIINTILITSLLGTNNLALIDFFNFDANVVPKEISNPVKIDENTQGIKTTAKSVVVIDELSGNILFEKNSNLVSSIASITKLMTAIVFLENNPKWEKVITIKQSDKRNGGIVYLLNGEQVYTQDLFYLTLVSSTNEAAAALARSSGLEEEEFVILMNQKAKELGLNSTSFTDPTGLDPNNKSTTYDLVKLARVAFSYDEIIKSSKLKGYDFTILNTGDYRYARNTNLLLNSFINNNTYSIEGSKTGYLDEAGYCQVIKVYNEELKRSIIVAILASQTIDDRWQEVKGIIDWTFSTYKW